MSDGTGTLQRRSWTKRELAGALLIAAANIFSVTYVFTSPDIRAVSAASREETVKTTKQLLNSTLNCN